MGVNEYEEECVMIPVLKYCKKITQSMLLPVVLFSDWVCSYKYNNNHNMTLVIAVN